MHLCSYYIDPILSRQHQHSVLSPTVSKGRKGGWDTRPSFRRKEKVEGKEEKSPEGEKVMRAMCALCCCLLFLTASASSSSSTKLDSTRAFHQVASHPSVPTRPTINHRAVNTPVKPSTPLPDLRPAVQELKNFYTTSLSSKRSSLTWEDLEALHEKFKLAVMRNKQARDQQKNPGAFGMEGCPYNSPQAALHFTETIQGSTPVAYLSTPCLSTDSFGEWVMILPYSDL